MKQQPSSVSWAVAVVVVTAIAGCGNSNTNWHDEGHAQAERDLAAGKLCVRTYGLPAPWFEKYKALAREKYGVEIDAVAGCVVDDGLRERANGYNEAMLQEIRRRFGRDALKSLAEAVRAQHQQEKNTVPPVVQATWVKWNWDPCAILRLPLHPTACMDSMVR
jgi:hypothetical protein